MFRAIEDGFVTSGFVQTAHAPDAEYAKDSMELLYMWIGKDDTCFIQRQGFNFSPNYQFNITDMGEDGYQLDWSEKREHFNVWNHQNIVNLTAIVGENGSGKTTLLRYLTAAPLMRNKKNSDDQLVQIYRIGNSVKIFCNLDEKVRFNAEQSCGGMRVSFADQGETEALLHQQTVVLMSNAASDVSLYNHDEKYWPIICTPEKNEERGGGFYLKASGLRSSMTEDFCSLQQEIVSDKAARCFDQLAAVSYYAQEKSDWFLDTNNREFWLSAVNPARWACEELLLKSGMRATSNSAQGAETFIMLLREYMELKETKAYKDLGAVLWDALCFEVLCLIKNTKQALDDPALFLEIRKDPVRYLRGHIYDNHGDVIKYYQMAQREIKELCGILRECGCTDRAHPSRWNNAAKTIVVERGKRQYRKFCKFVEQRMKMPTSFVLKHMMVSMPPQSSGEKAIQNLFSWLRLPPYFQEILGERSVAIGDYMLLMLDEVDLYMHPEWQRKFLKLLSDGLDQEYRDKKIQVIITTHSPLVLSDIPRENVVYLKRDGNKCKIVDGPDMEETFGANIFSLLKDSFFLSKTMGEFAHTRIEKVIGDLEKLKKSPQDLKLKKECRQLIEHIGEPIIRRKLMMMYDEAVSSAPGYLDRQSLERFSRLLESQDPEVGRQVRDLVYRYLTENEPG